MPNSIPFLRDIFLDDDKYLSISKCIDDEPDKKFDQKFLLESINFYEKHKHDINSAV